MIPNATVQPTPYMKRRAAGVGDVSSATTTQRDALQNIAGFPWHIRDPVFPVFLRRMPGKLNKTKLCLLFWFVYVEIQ
jgi:hypothetical protein